MKIKTSELTGAALDYAVAMCEGGTDFRYDTVATYWITINGKDHALSKGWAQSYMPSTNWTQGGPIIEREEIGTKRNAPCSDGRQWEAKPSITAKGAGGKYGYGPTPLIAAMRCYVASKLGEEVEIPEDLSSN